MADVKKFNGFLALDGTPYPTKKAAIEHTANLKTAAALVTLSNQLASDTEFQTDDDRVAIIDADNLPLYLAKYKDQIIAAFNPEVSKRAPRKPKTAPAAAAATA